MFSQFVLTVEIQFYKHSPQDCPALGQRHLLPENVEIFKQRQNMLSFRLC